MNQKAYPPGWDEERVKRVLAHYEQQSEEEAVAEDEAAFEKNGEADGGALRTDSNHPRTDRQAPELELIVRSPHARVHESCQD